MRARVIGNFRHGRMYVIGEEVDLPRHIFERLVQIGCVVAAVEAEAADAAAADAAAYTQEASDAAAFEARRELEREPLDPRPALAVAIEALDKRSFERVEAQVGLGPGRGSQGRLGRNAELADRLVELGVTVEALEEMRRHDPSAPSPDAEKAEDPSPPSSSKRGRRR